MNKKLTVVISRTVALRMLRLDRELTVRLSYGGPDALPNAYKWRTPWGPAWARLECPQLRVDVSDEGTVETPKRPYGRLGRAFRGYAGYVPGGDELVRRYYRNGRNDPATQEAAADAVLRVLRARFGATPLGELAAQVVRGAPLAVQEAA